MELEKASKVKMKPLKTKDLPYKEEYNLMPCHDRWTPQYYAFIQKFQETLDVEYSFKEAGVTSKSLKANILSDRKVQKAMSKTTDNWLEATEINAKNAAAKFLKVFNKMEKAFDEGDTKVASALSNMATTFLKATNQLGNKDNTMSGKVEININLGHHKPTKQVIVEPSIEGDYE